MSALPVTDLGYLAAEINAEHAAGADKARSAVQHARRAGMLLLEAKARLNHGEWLPWLQAHCPDISTRSATGYMRVARQPSNPEIESQTLRDALAALANPKSATVADLPKWDPADPIQREVMELLELHAGSHPRHIPLPTFLPLEPGMITIGLIEDVPRFVLFESRRHPGYWCNLDLQNNSLSTRPVLPIGLCIRYAQAPEAQEVVWGVWADDGELAEVMEAA